MRNVLVHFVLLLLVRIAPIRAYCALARDLLTRPDLLCLAWHFLVLLILHLLLLLWTCCRGFEPCLFHALLLLLLSLEAVKFFDELVCFVDFHAGFGTQLVARNLPDDLAPFQSFFALHTRRAAVVVPYELVDAVTHDLVAIFACNVPFLRL